MCTPRIFGRIGLTLIVATVIALALQPLAGNTASSEPQGQGDYDWAGTYVSADKFSTLTISGEGDGMTAQGRWTPSSAQYDVSEWVSCTVVGATATCQVQNGHYHDGDKDQYYGGLVTATLSGGNRLTGQTTITGGVREEWRVARYPSAHSKDAVFPFDLKRTTPAVPASAKSTIRTLPLNSLATATAVR